MNATFAATQPREQQLADMGVALTTRAIENSGLRHDRVDRHKPRPHGEDWQAFYNMPTVDFCRACLIVDGKDEQLTKQAPADACYRAAFGFQTREFGAAYHVSPTLPALLFDAFNKSLDAGYEEAPSTWEQVFSRGEPAKDFKDLHRIKMGEIPSLPFWGNNQDPSVAGVADEKVTYAVEARALSVDYSYQAVINDDLGTLARVTAALGASAKRTVNAVAYAVFTSQPTLPDGQPPWSAPTGQRYRSNLTTGVAIPDVATLNTMRTKMRLLRGLNTPEGNESDAIIAMDPARLLVPSSLAEDAQQTVESSADPDGAHEHVHNPFFGMDRVVEPRLDGDSSTAFYLLVDPVTEPGRGVEVTFLDGHDLPQFDMHRDPGTLSLRFTVRQVYAAAWLDYRGVQRHDGT